MNKYLRRNDEWKRHNFIEEAMRYRKFIKDLDGKTGRQMDDKVNINNNCRYFFKTKNQRLR